MDVSEVLKKAWTIIWKHKVLWIFGILAGCSGNTTNSSGGGGGGGASSGSGGGGGGIGGDLPLWADQIEPYIPFIIIGMIILITIIILLALVLGTIGRTGLVIGTKQADEGAEKLIFSELFSATLPFFWRVVGLVLLVGIVTFLGVLLVGVPLTVVTCGLGGIALFLALLAIPIIVEMSINAIVIENLGIMDGLRRGWEIFRANLMMMVVMGLILNVGIGLLSAIVVAVPMLLLAAPFIFGVLLTGGQAVEGGLIFSGVCLCGLLPVLIALLGGVRAYTGAAWTLTYLRLNGAAPAPAPMVMENLPDPY